MLNRNAWNKGLLIGQKPPLKPKEIWSLGIRLQRAQETRDLAMFNLALDSKLRGCDLVMEPSAKLSKASPPGAEHTVHCPSNHYQVSANTDPFAHRTHWVLS